MLNLTTDQASDISTIATLNQNLSRNITEDARLSYTNARRAALSRLTPELRAAAPMNDGWRAADNWLRAQNITN